MAIISGLKTFSSGAIIYASDHNNNDGTIWSDYNGNITNSNISASAAIAYSKLLLTGGIVNADISASAAIAASKLSLVSPGAIGSTTPSTGAFSTLKVGTTNQGDILYDNGTTFVRLTPGTAGQALLTGGAAANPSWGTGGALVFVSNTVVSAAVASTDIAITSTNYYKVIIHLGALSAADTIAIRVNNDNGASYNWAFDGRTTGGALTGGGAGDTEIEITTAMVSNANSYLQAEFTITPADSNILLFGGKSCFRENAGSLQSYVDFMGYSSIATPVSFRVFTTGTATMSGNILLYRLATA